MTAIQTERLSHCGQTQIGGTLKPPTVDLRTNTALQTSGAYRVECLTDRALHRP